MVRRSVLTNYFAGVGIYECVMIRRAAIGLLVLCFAAGAFGQGSTATESKIIKNNLSPAEVDRIIKKVAENEGDFRAALTNYVFTRDAIVSTVGMGGQTSGVYHRDRKSVV